MTAKHIPGLLAVVIATATFEAVAAAATTEPPPDHTQLAVTSVPEPPSPSADSAPATDTIPDGTYTKIATREDGEALGLDDAFLDAAVGTDGEAPITIEIVGDRWTQSSTNDAGITEVGDLGTSSYDDAGHWVAVSESCPGCVGVFDWTYNDGVLNLTFAPIEGAEDIPLDARFVMEGDYQRQGDDEAAAGTGAQSTVTPRFANPLDSAPPQLVAFVEEVQRLSDGTIEFEWLPDYGESVLTDLADSTVDIGWVGPGWGGDLYLPGFEALVAPLLVDSHDLQEQVFEAGIPARMLADLDEPGLVGIVVLPGPLRRIVGVEHPLASLADFAGQTIDAENTAVSSATWKALGATDVGGTDLPFGNVDGHLAHFGAITGSQWQDQADFVTANLNPWPRPLAIVMSAESFEALTPEQQEILIAAGAEAIAPAMEGSRAEDADPGPLLCDAPIAVIEASEADLAEIEAALEPVYAELEEDPGTAAYLDEIRALKDELSAPPDTLTCSDQ